MRPRRSLPAHRSYIDRYDAARPDAASVLAAFLARWKHTHLRDRDSYDSDLGATSSSVKRACARRFHLPPPAGESQTGISFDLQLEGFDQFRPAQSLLLRECVECVETHALDLNTDLSHPFGKIAACQQGVELWA